MYKRSSPEITILIPDAAIVSRAWYMNPNKTLLLDSAREFIATYLRTVAVWGTYCPV